jgi:hypothetical protein
LHPGESIRDSILCLDEIGSDAELSSNGPPGAMPQWAT